MLKTIKFGLFTLLFVSISILGFYGAAPASEIKKGGTITVGVDAGPLG